MSRTITPPKTQIPIGLVTIDGKQVEVKQHPEFVRFFFDLFARVGGANSLSNSELLSLVMSLDDAAGRMDVLAAGLAAIQASVDRLQASEVVVQPLDSFDPISAEVTWQI